MKPPLREVTLVTNRRAESVATAVLEALTGIVPGVHTDADTGTVSVSVYGPVSETRAKELRRALREAVRDMADAGVDPAPGGVRIRAVPARNWSESWKRHFKPVVIGKRLLVKPTWARRKPLPGQAVVLLDPGLSFGTGQHATTRFCLAELARLRDAAQTQSLLDAGTGSGILALGAAALGYQPVEGFDFDPDCVRTALANARLNRLQDRVQFTQADVTRLPKKSARRYDVVCANLIHDLLIAHASVLAARVAEGGHLVLAGILAPQFPAVERTFKALGWRRLRDATEGEWRSGTFARSRA